MRYSSHVNTETSTQNFFLKKVLFCNRNDKSILSYIIIRPNVMYIRGSWIPLEYSVPLNWTDLFKHCVWHYMVSTTFRGTLQSEWRCCADTSYSTHCHKATFCTSIGGNLKLFHYGEPIFWLCVVISILKKASQSALVKYVINSQIYVSTTNIYWSNTLHVSTY